MNHVPLGPLTNILGVFAVVVVFWAITILALGRLLATAKPRRRAAHSPVPPMEKRRHTRDDFTLAA